MIIRAMSKRAWCFVLSAVIAGCSPYRNETAGAVNPAPFSELMSVVSAVSGTGTRDLFAAGGVASTSCTNSRTLAIAHWDGAQWTSNTVPMGMATAAAIESVSASEAYAIATTCAATEPASVFFRWNGTAWTQIGTAPAGTVTAYVRIEVLGPNSVWFATDNAFGYWDGTQFVLAPPTSGTNKLRGFAAFSATDVLVFAQDNNPTPNVSLRRLTNGSWSTLETPSAASLLALASSDNGSVLLATTDGLFRWDGTSAPAGPIANNRDSIVGLAAARDGSYFVERQACVRLCNDLSNMLCRGACSSSVKRGSAMGERDWPRLPQGYFRGADNRYYQWQGGFSLSLESFE